MFPQNVDVDAETITHTTAAAEKNQFHCSNLSSQQIAKMALVDRHQGGPMEQTEGFSYTSHAKDVAAGHGLLGGMGDPLVFPKKQRDDVFHVVVSGNAWTCGT